MIIIHAMVSLYLISQLHVAFALLTDINECTNNNGGCEDVCTNIIGSYTCSCQLIGYHLDNDKHNCSGDNYKHSLCVLK